MNRRKKRTIKNSRSKSNIKNNNPSNSNRGGLKIISWNIESRNDATESKLHDTDFLKVITKNDIICFQETWGPVYLANHRSFNSNRTDSKSGGVAILVKNNISKGVSLIKTPNTSTTDIVAIKLSKYFSKLKTILS